MDIRWRRISPAPESQLLASLLTKKLIKYLPFLSAFAPPSLHSENCRDGSPTSARPLCFFFCLSMISSWFIVQDDIYTAYRHEVGKWPRRKKKERTKKPRH